MYKTALITGASDGLGKQLVLQLAQTNIETIIICGRNAKKLDAVTKQLTNYNKNVCSLAFDLKDLKQLTQFMDNITQLYTIDLVINNAGLNTNKHTIHHLSIEEMQHMLNVNCVAPTLIMQKIIPSMQKHQYGMIVNILSTVCKHDIPEFAAYSASKKAFESICNTTRKLVKDDGICVFNVYPGGMDSNFRVEQRPNYLQVEDVAKMIIQSLNKPQNMLVQELLIRPISENNY